MRFARVTPLLALPAVVAAAPALAGDLPAFSQLAPQPSSDDSIWKGLTVGVEGYVVGARGMKGAVGGATTVAWSRALDNNLILGLKASAGHMPAFWLAQGAGRPQFVGANFVTTQATLAYDLGRVRPWASVGAGFYKPTNFGGRGFDAVNSFFDEPGKARGLISYGAGVDYAVSNKLTIGVGVYGVARQ